MKNTTDNIQNTNRGSNGGQTTISGASNPHKLRDSAQTMKLSPMMQEYCKTKEENENVGIQIETSKTQVIPVETREIMNKNRGTYQGDKVKDETQKHTDEECKPKDVKDFDGDKNTGTHVDIDYTEINENDYIPNTNMTWRQFANKCGYRGEGMEGIRKSVEVVQKMDVVNQETLNKYIEDTEDDFDDDHSKR